MLLRICAASRVDEHHVRMHEHAAHARRHRNLLDVRIVDADRQHQAAVQRRRNVVDVHRAARDRLAPASRTSAARSLSERFGSSAFAATTPATADAPSRRAPSRAECPSRSSSSNAEIELQVAHHASTAMPAVLRSGSSGRSGTTPRMAAMRTPGVATRTAPHAIAERLDAVTEHVEADGDVADARRCEGSRRRGACSQLRAQVRADAQQVGEHAAGGDRRTGARTLHDQRDCGRSAASRSARRCR